MEDKNLYDKFIAQAAREYIKISLAETRTITNKEWMKAYNKLRAMIEYEQQGKNPQDYKD